VTASHADHGDGELAMLCRAGDHAAFGEIVRRYKQPLHCTVSRLTGDADEAVDIVQDAFVAAHAAIATYDPGRPMRTWLTRIAVNKARDWRRRRIVRRLVSAVMPHDAIEVADDAPPIDGAVADRAELRRVEAAIARLPAKLREVLVLRTIDGLSQAEVADALGASEKAVETRLYRARTKLRDDLAR
jgi:RNA polymerase sigma-70 factor (ECF subfamily)